MIQLDPTNDPSGSYVSIQIKEMNPKIKSGQVDLRLNDLAALIQENSDWKFNDPTQTNRQ